MRKQIGPDSARISVTGVVLERFIPLGVKIHSMLPMHARAENYHCVLMQAKDSEMGCQWTISMNN